MHRFKRFAGSCIKTLGQTGKTAIIFIPMNTETKYNVGWHTEEGFSETATEPSLTLALSGDITKPPLSRRRGDGSPAVTSKRGWAHPVSPDQVISNSFRKWPPYYAAISPPILGWVKKGVFPAQPHTPMTPFSTPTGQTTQLCVPFAVRCLGCVHQFLL